MTEFEAITNNVKNYVVLRHEDLRKIVIPYLDQTMVISIWDDGSAYEWLHSKKCIEQVIEELTYLDWEVCDNCTKN